MPVAKKLEAFVWALGLTQCTCGCAVSHSTTAYEKQNIRHQQLHACIKHSHSTTSYAEQNIKHQQLLACNQAQPVSSCFEDTRHVQRALHGFVGLMQHFWSHQGREPAK